MKPHIRQFHDLWNLCSLVISLTYCIPCRSRGFCQRLTCRNLAGHLVETAHIFLRQITGYRCSCITVYRIGIHCNCIGHRQSSCLQIIGQIRQRCCCIKWIKVQFFGLFFSVFIGYCTFRRILRNLTICNGFIQLSDHTCIGNGKYSLTINEILNDLIRGDGIRIQCEEAVETLIIHHAFHSFIKIHGYLTLVISVLSAKICIATQKHIVFNHVSHVPLKHILNFGCHFAGFIIF